MLSPPAVHRDYVIIPLAIIVSLELKTIKLNTPLYSVLFYCIPSMVQTCACNISLEI